VAHDPFYRRAWGLVHGLSVEHDDDQPMAGARGRKGARERSRWGGAGWGAMPVGALVVRMPLVRGMLTRHRSSSQRVGEAWLGAQWRQCMGTRKRAVWPQKSCSNIGRGVGQWGCLG
jgi:hypothetical protein